MKPLVESGIAEFPGLKSEEVKDHIIVPAHIRWFLKNPYISQFEGSQELNLQLQIGWGVAEEAELQQKILQ